MPDPTKPVDFNTDFLSFLQNQSNPSGSFGVLESDVAGPDFLTSLQQFSNPDPFSVAPPGSFDAGYTPPETPGTGFQGISAGIKGFGALANAYLGYKNLKLGEEQFDFAKGSFNTNLANQAKLTNVELANQERRRLTAAGANTRGQPGEAERIEASLSSFLDKNKLSGTPI